MGSAVLYEHLAVKKICSRWIPHNLSIAQKKTRVDWSKEILQKYDRSVSKHVYDVVAGDKSWIYAYEPESKQQSTVWIFQNEANPTKVACARSTSKQMIACFCFGKIAHVAIVPLEQCRTVNSKCYTTIYLPVVFLQEIRKISRRRRMDHSSPRQCKLSHIGSNNCIFVHSKHRFEESSSTPNDFFFYSRT